MFPARSRALLTLLVFLSAPSTGSAHNNSWQDVPGPHGGVVARAGEFRLELCLSDARLKIWVTDHFREGAQIDVRNAKGFATLVDENRQITLALEPELGNLMIGAAEFPPSALKNLTVSLTLSGRTSRSAHFSDFERAYRCKS